MTEIELLKKAIDNVEAITKNKEWLESLEPRKKEEAEFHDFSHDQTTELENKKFYKTTAKSNSYLQNWLKENVKGKILLDFACGNGVTSIEAAEYGAEFVIGLDISSGSISNAKKLAEQKGFNNKTRFFVGDCENTQLPENSIDVVLCAGMLHHLDLNFAFPELKRILKPGGKIIAVEALDYNPFIKAYRLLTPGMRTEWEKHHILSMKDVRFASKFFKVNSVKFWHITSFAAAFFGSKKWMLVILNGVDDLLTKIPVIRLLSWQFIFELEKERNNASKS
jgi:ubiquinone/menaquinone biosynthesis C-methylase UbiE